MKKPKLCKWCYTVGYHSASSCPTGKFIRRINSFATTLKKAIREASE